jgi:hypothetical protein
MDILRCTPIWLYTHAHGDMPCMQVGPPLTQMVDALLVLAPGGVALAPYGKAPRRQRCGTSPKQPGPSTDSRERGEGEIEPRLQEIQWHWHGPGPLQED